MGLIDLIAGAQPNFMKIASTSDPAAMGRQGGGADQQSRGGIPIMGTMIPFQNMEKASISNRVFFAVCGRAIWPQ